MINKIMKISGEKAYPKDLARIDLSQISGDIREVKDVSYSDDGIPEHKLDIYYADDGNLKPVLIDIHGGGFISYGKEFDRVYANVFAQKGFTVFEIDFRLAYPEYTVFDQIEDIDKAVRRIVSNAASYGGDTDRLYIAGHSSGCVLAAAEALLTLSSEMRSDYGFEDKDYQYKGILLDCGLMHFYKNSIAYNGMRKMVFPKDYEEDKRYGYLLFDENEDIKKLPKTALITNEKDILKKMTYHFEKILINNSVEHRLFGKGSKGHTGAVFKPCLNGYDLIGEVAGYLL
ncbi:MAG: alpha/beta hydrolase fold domain-containing protein [Saccharofermentans sp.]|nr:alpha/beta hydrolase fold domain-containing protein [Saccharofermentans sp.]